MAGEPVRLFLDSAGNGPRAAAAAQTVEAAAAAFPRAHRAVRSVVAAAAGRGDAGVGDGKGGIVPGPLGNGAVEQDGGVPQSGTKGMAVVEAEGARGRAGERLADAEVEASGGTGSGSGSSGEVAAEEMELELLAMEREDAVARASTCREALGGWWERQRAAVEGRLLDREKEAADRRWLNYRLIYSHANTP